MARTSRRSASGFELNVTDIGESIVRQKDAVHDALAWDDLDGDGCIDLIAIAVGDDDSHEVVGAHVPSGNVVWRALRGEASAKLSLVDGVLVVSTDDGEALRGLDPRTGAEAWRLRLPSALEEDPFDGDNRAPAIVGSGAFAAFECVDGTAHVVEAKTGRLCKTVEGELHAAACNVPGAVAFKTRGGIELWSLAQGRAILRAPDDALRTLHGTGTFALMHESDGAPGGGSAARVTVFDARSHQELGVAWLTGVDGEATPRFGDAEYGVVGGYLLAENRVVFGDCGDPAYVGQLVPGTKTLATRWTPPQPGYELAAMVWCAPVIAIVWRATEAFHRLIVAGYDPSSLAARWTVEELGGTVLVNLLHTTGAAVLAPRSGTDYYDAETNPCCMVQLDPETGANVAEYPLETVDCVSLHGPFLCGATDAPDGGTPTAYDTTKRTRVL